MANETLIALKKLSRFYMDRDGGKIEIIRALDFTVSAGSFNVISGESGSGKTTLLRILGMLDTEFHGEYMFGGCSIRGQSDWYLDELRSLNIGFVFQDGRLFDHMTVSRNITLPLQLHLPSISKGCLNERVEDLTGRFFSDEKRSQIMNLKPVKASGGEKQRVSIVRAIVNKPSLILADEPTASLNGELKDEVVEYLHSLCFAGHTVVVVSHDDVFYGHGNQYKLRDGRLFGASS